MRLMGSFLKERISTFLHFLPLLHIKWSQLNAELMAGISVSMLDNEVEAMWHEMGATVLSENFFFV